MKNIIFALSLFAFLVSCKEEIYDFGAPPTGIDFNYQIDSTNTLRVKLIPINIDTPMVKVAWDFGFGSTLASRRSTIFSPNVNFPEPGIYTVTMIVYNDGGINNIEKIIEVKLPPGPNISPDLQVLAGLNPLGKAWIVNRFVNGHSSAGRPANVDDITSFWSRPAENMACLGMYNDVYIFKAEDGKLMNNEFVLSTGGDTYARQNFDTKFTVKETPAQAGCNTFVPTPVLSGADRRVLYDAPSGLTYNVSTNPANERKILNLSQGGYIGMWVDTTVYEALVYTPDSLTLTMIQPGNGVRWAVKLVPLPTEYLLLTGGTLTGKTWVVAKDLDGHSGAGNPTGNTPNIWSRNANTLACLGLYNDEYTFKLDGLSFGLETGGDIYTRVGLDSSYSEKKLANTICPSGSTISGNDVVAFANSPGNLTWTMRKGDNGKGFIRISNGGYIGMDVSAPEYEIVTITENLLELRFLQKGGTVAWYLKLVPKG